MFRCPKPYRQEFRDDVVKVARGRLKGTTIEQTATDFGDPSDDASKLLCVAAIDEGERASVTTHESTENRELRRRVRLLEQENEVLTQAAAYLGRANLPKADVPARV